MTKAKGLGMRSALFAVAASAVLASCGGGGGGTAPVPMGQLRVALTDAPGCGFDQVNVTVERVRVHQSASAGDGEAGWSDVAIVGGPRRMDLLTLNNGVIAELGQVTLPAGQYQQIRLVLGRNAGGMGMMANSVMPTGSMSEMPLDTPSGSQSGIKLIHGFTVEPNRLTDVLLDFDACRSIVLRGNGTHSMKPVISVLPRTGTAIAGVVDASMTNVTVSAQKKGVVLRATRPAADGKFLLAPVDPNQTSYDVVFTAPDRTTMVVTNVPVILDKVTTVNSTALTMAASPSGTVTGVVSPVAAAATGSVRALQKVGSIPAIEVAYVNTNPQSGAYSLTVPTAAPMLAPYSAATPPVLTFVSQAGPGNYTLEASATGYLPKPGSEITVPAGATLPNQDFALSVTP
jgi:hypothetical protein